MTNGQFAALAVAVLAAHVAALLAACVRRRGPGPMAALNAAAATCVLAYVAAHPKAFANGVDWQIVGLAGFEVLVLIAAGTAPRRRLARVASWIAFAAHMAASVGAVAFALLFRITRLI